MYVCTNMCLPPLPQSNTLPEAPDVGANPLNEDAPSSVEEFARDFNSTVDTYIENIRAYQEALSEVEEVNELGERVINLVSIYARSWLSNSEFAISKPWHEDCTVSQSLCKIVVATFTRHNCTTVLARY